MGQLPLSLLVLPPPALAKLSTTHDFSMETWGRGIMRLTVATRYLVALFCVLFAALIHLQFSDLLRDRPFPVFFLAILLVAAIAGPGPTVFATALSAILAVSWFTEPIGAFKVLGVGDLLRLVSFLIVGFSVALFVELKNRALERAVIAARELAEERGRQLTGAAVESREAFMRQVLDSLPHEVAVIDADGTVVMVNMPWEKFAEENSGSPCRVSAGVNYLRVCKHACEDGDSFAANALGSGPIKLLA